MKLEDHPSYDGHEALVAVGDPGLRFAGFIAIHSTVLGPSAGGCRIWRYENGAEAALTDVLRLSRGMTYKNAMADLPLGGGKAVLYEIGADRAACFEALGAQIEALGGRYIAAEDVGATVADMRAIARRTSYVAGIPKQDGKAGGDPSPWTALGVFVSIEALLGGSVRGKSVAVQGVGAVGYGLCRMLAENGAKLIVADLSEKNLARATALGAQSVAPDRIHAVRADVFSPCALGAGLNARTIPELSAPIVCGAANNQLETEADGARLMARGIAYAPDYVVNAGGIISVSAEYLGESEAAVDRRVRAIAPRLLAVMDEAKLNALPPHQAADAMVREKIAQAKKERA